MTIRSFGVAAVFLAGCAVGSASARFVVPAASAQQAAMTPAWEYQCASLGSDADDLTVAANRLGAQQWEMTGVIGNTGWVTVCFKRVKL